MCSNSFIKSGNDSIRVEGEPVIINFDFENVIKRFVHFKEILENDNIIKIGVAPQGDATYLARDYEIKVANTFDLRHMAVMCGYPSGGLAKLSKSILNVELDKNWTIICSDWEAAVLSSKQIDYAAKDAHVAIEIFKILADRLIPEPLFSSKLKHVQNILNYYCSEFFNIQYNGLCNSGKGHEINPNDYDYNLNSPAVNHVGRLDMRIGRIIKIEKAVEKDADALYLMKVNIGDEIRPIVARLAKFIPADQLLNQNVVVLCNIKPIKLKGYLSNGMILRANSEDLMEPLIPPPNAEPGDLVHCENYERAPVEKPRDKRRLYNPLFIDMATNNELVACYKSSCLYIPGKGYIVAKSLKNASIG